MAEYPLIARPAQHGTTLGVFVTPEEASKILNQPRYDVNQAAEKLQVSRSSIQRLRNSGALRYLRVGGKIQFTEEHLAEVIKEAERKALPEQRCARRRPHAARRTA